MNEKKERKRKEVFYLCCYCGTIIKSNRNNLERHEKLHKKNVEKIECAAMNCEVTFANKHNYYVHWQQQHKDIIMPDVLNAVIEPGKPPP